ncbi:hypothetical protein [Flavihumibacter profundi]|jgi:hypothetical protein|uniref:hypothetical protein n=1 Tax=Flavihumibacter profundi TaxID=2716883 RepID=UPI001CC804FF|nr:hypothetical protein [Flavihumibacter profundi]MBZ5857121.1 hypothetical protein [Flavihumibacter profundi]
MKIVRALVGTFLLFFTAKAQNGYLTLKGWQPAAGTWSHIFNSPAAPFVNPAAFASLSRPALLLVSQKPFYINELSELQAFAGWPVANGSGAGLVISRFGNASFNEIHYGLGYGLHLNSHWQLGVSFLYLTGKFSGFSARSGLQAATGLQWFNNGFSAGLFYHSAAIQLPYKTSRLWLIGGGMGKDWSGQLYTDGSVYFTVYEGLVASISLQYQLLEAWRLAIRIQSNPLRYGFESGYFHKAISLRIYSEWHPQIGWSPGLVLGISKKQKTAAHEQDNIY